ncbi:MAG TPA: hypothetical protein VF498_04410, partial [Anaerolineales bacterium]
MYSRFQAPITALNCGDKCAPHNERGVPFCCDTYHAVPTAYQAEWEYLQNHTDLWHLWESDDPEETAELQKQTPTGQVLVGCQGAKLCQRGFRSITCRAFPFFPYLTRSGEFIGLSYYWEYEDRCWVISNLHLVSPGYRAEFITAYEELFEKMPEERENFRYHSMIMRRIFGRRKRSIPLLHQNGGAYKVTPRNGRKASAACWARPVSCGGPMVS